MSEENAEIVRLAYADYNDTGLPREDLFDSDFTLWESPDLPGDLAGRGYATWIRQREVLLTSFEHVSLEPERCFDRGDRVLVLVTARARGIESGVQVEARYGHLWTLRGGKVIELKVFGDQREALQAVGLSE